MSKGDEPERFPPPPFWRTQYFALTAMGKTGRRRIEPHMILSVLNNPIRKARQDDGRVQYWGWVWELQTYIRVVTLSDGETVHNAFLDRDFES